MAVCYVSVFVCVCTFLELCVPRWVGDLFFCVVVSVGEYLCIFVLCVSFCLCVAPYKLDTISSVYVSWWLCVI